MLTERLQSFIFKRDLQALSIQIEQTCLTKFNPLPEDRMLALSKLKAFTDNKLNVLET